MMHLMMIVKNKTRLRELLDNRGTKQSWLEEQAKNQSNNVEHDCKWECVT